MDTNTYRDFTLRVSALAKKTHRYTVEVYGLVPGGQPDSHEHETLTFRPEVFDVEVDGEPANLLDLLRERSIDAQIFHLGGILSDLILPKSIRRRFSESLRIVSERQQRLRLRLLIEARELAVLPWEYLYLRPSGELEDNEQFFLALQPNISIVRHEAIDEPEPRVETRERYRLVAALAAPTDQLPLQIQEDRKAIEAMITGVAPIGVVEPAWVENATRARLRSALRDHADIFHFAGHGIFQGSAGQIVLDRTGDGLSSDYYNARFLANLLFKAGVRLAVLGACETAMRSPERTWDGVASALVRAGLAAVVASQFQIQDRNVPPMVEELYRGILSGQTLDEAVANARTAIYQQAGLENRDWGALVLYLRVADGIVFPLAHTPAGDGQRLPQTIITINQRIEGDVYGQVTGVSAGTIGTGVAATPVTGVAPDQRQRFSPNILPTSITERLIGRENELAQVQGALGDGGKFYFYGTYGVGKTSLATELFNRMVREKTFGDGYLWYRVTNMTPEQMLEQVAEAFPEQQVAQAQGQDDKIIALRMLLAGRGNMLIGLDEVRDPAVARALLAAASSCTVILNGARALNLAGQIQERELEPLTTDEASQLFVSLSTPDQTTATLSEERAWNIRRICERLRNLPLAVRLAALKHAEGESLEVLWDRLQEAQGTLISSDEALAAIFETSYADLQKMPAALRLLIRLAGFPALEASLGSLRLGERSLDFFQAKDKLIALGLVYAVGTDRLALHPVLGVGVQNAEPDALDSERQRTATWLQEYARTNREAYEMLAREHANLIGLLDWFATQQQWDDFVSLIRDLFNYLRVRGQWEEALQRLQLVLESAANLASPWNRGWAYLHRGILHLLRSNYAAAELDFDQADKLFVEVDDQAYRGKVLYRRGTLSIVRGELSTARQQLEQALEWMSDKAPAHDRSDARARLASVLAIQGDLDGARQQYDQALTIGAPEEQARVHIALGELARHAGDYATAEGQYKQAIELTAQIGHVLYRATTEQELGYLYYYQGRFDEATAHFTAAQVLFQQLCYQPGLAQALHAIGNVALARGDLAGAKRDYEDALTINQDRGIIINQAYNQYQLGVVAYRSGDRQPAEDRYKEALASAERAGDIALEAAALLQLGSLALERRDRQIAAGFFTQALELATRAGDRLTEATSRYYQGLLQAQEGHLDAARQTLDSAHEIFVALHSVDAAVVAQVLQDVSRPPAPPIPSVDSGPLVLGIDESDDSLAAASGAAGFEGLVPELAGRDDLKQGVQAIGALLDNLKQAAYQVGVIKEGGIVFGAQVGAIKGSLVVSVKIGDGDDEKAETQQDINVVKEGGIVMGAPIDEL